MFDKLLRTHAYINHIGTTIYNARIIIMVEYFHFLINCFLRLSLNSQIGRLSGYIIEAIKRQRYKNDLSEIARFMQIYYAFIFKLFFRI